MASAVRVRKEGVVKGNVLMRCSWCRSEISGRESGEWRSAYLERRGKMHRVGCPVGGSILRLVDRPRAHRERTVDALEMSDRIREQRRKAGA
jgi:hypothetical protein